MMAAALANMTVGGDRRSHHSAHLQNDRVSQSKAAELLNISPRLVAEAAKIRREAAPELVEADRAAKRMTHRFATPLGMLGDLRSQRQPEAFYAAIVARARRHRGVGRLAMRQVSPSS
jgi:hypothetical protein